jgi:hypothetical protein
MMATKPMSPERLAEQVVVIEKALRSRRLNRFNGVMVSAETNEQIVKSHTGELKNTIQVVFKNRMGKNSCEHCGVSGVVLERAHTRAGPEIALEALDEIHPDPRVPIALRDFISAFLRKHTEVGIWLLCKKCHKTLG